MATTIGELVWKINGDTKDIDSSLKSTDSKLQAFGKAVVAAFSVAAVIAFTRKAADLGNQLITLASSAEETANKFNVVFNGMQAASDAAENLASNYGLSSEASQRLLSDTADLLQGFGVQKAESLALSEATQQLAVDLASFNNKDPEEASRALTSALLGEREAVKSLGIAITDAELIRFAEEQGQVYNEMTKAEKAVLTLQLAYKQSGNAIGDFSRSQESFANQLRIANASVQDLGASIGEDLLPVATRAVTKFNEFAQELLKTRQQFDGLKDAIDAQREGEATLDQQLQILIARRERYTGLTQRQKEALDAEIQALQRQIGIRDSNIARIQVEAEERLRAAEVIEETSDNTTDIIVENAQRRLAAQAAENEVIRSNYEYEQEIALSLAEYKTALREQEQEEEELRHAQRLANIQSELSAYSTYAGNVGNIFSNLISALTAGDKELTEKKKKNIIALYRLQQAANIAQIAIDTAAAIIRLWANPGFPAAIPLSVVVGALGATQLAVVAATPPPALQDGGIVPAAPGGTTVIAGEQGVPEAIVPLDSANNLGNMTLIVNLDGSPIIKRTQLALNNREIVVYGSSVDGTK